jgi:dTDP-4-amino-4,6-dideoxygalactose transaminase
MRETIPLFKVFMSDEATTAAASTLACGYITQGPRVKELEKDLARAIGNGRF